LTWSKDFPSGTIIKGFLYIFNGAEVDVLFKCPKCEQELEVDCLEIPDIASYIDDESNIWGPTERIECFCGETYYVIAENSITGWKVEFENVHGLTPRTFLYRIMRYYDIKRAQLFRYYTSGTI
jgi:hypothetical protein